MFAVIFICGNLFLQIAGKNRKNWNPQKISCHTVSSISSQLKTLVSGSLNSGTHPVPFWCIFAQSAVIRKIYIRQLMMDCYFLERERYVKKKKCQSHSFGGVRRTKHVPGFCDGFWILGSVFGFWDVFWPFWQVFCSYEPRYIQTTLLLSNHFKKMCY